ncbi:hypothetical protein COU53_01630 [Candidatus Pacearchaeota archaeon CG10_big_fil_rev_8_21_14_0_10_30_48]|nr:MAG: hypothetical protein COU53_01630 [Candidatus Pacearchaeota archaeon CG10_big_fil_rev_8_21_14_0_10_30_48]
MEMTLYQNKAFQVLETIGSNYIGDKKIEIAFEGDYLTIAIVSYKDFKDCAEHVRNWANILDGLNSWFGGPASIDNYFERVERGETNPLQEWESIKVRFGLSDKFDVRESKFF